MRIVRPGLWVVLWLGLVPDGVAAWPAPPDAQGSAPAAATLQPMTVHGKKPSHPRPALVGGAAVTDLAGETLRRRHPELALALAEQAGLQVWRTSGVGSAAMLTVRGSSTEQVNVAIDDVPICAADGGALDLGDLPLGAIERIEVYRGLVPPWLGSQPLGGALRLRLRQRLGSSGETTAAIGSFGTSQVENGVQFQSETARIVAGWRWLSSRGDFLYRADPGTPGNPTDDVVRRRGNNAVSRHGTVVAADWRVAADTLLSARWLGSWLAQGVPGAALYPAAAARFDQQRHMAILQLQQRDVWRGGDRLLASVQGTARDAEVNDRLGELGLPWHLSRAITAGGATLAWQGPLGGSEGTHHQALARVDVTHARVQGTDVLHDEALPQSTRTMVTATTALPLDWGNWQLTPSAGMDWAVQRLLDARQYPFAWTETGATVTVPWFAALAVGWTPWPTVSVHASVRRGTRLPNLQELFGDTTVIMGNARLSNEHALAAELGGAWTLRSGAATALFDLRLHQTWAEDLIQLVGLGARQAIYQNIATATLGGAEAAVRMGWAGWHIDLQHTSLWTRDTSGRSVYDGKVLPMRPRTRWNGRIEATPWRAGAVAATPWVSGMWQSGTFVDTANLIALPARAVASAGLRIEVAGSGAFAELRVDNVTDEPWFDLVGYPLPGRAVWLQTGWRPSAEVQR